MAATFELHAKQKPIYRYAPSLSTYKSSTTPIKNTSINSPSEVKPAVTDLLWSEMSRGGWVQDKRLTDKFSQGPRNIPDLDIPTEVDHEEKLYDPLVTYFNAITRKSSLRIIDTSKYSPRASQDETKDLPKSPDSAPVKKSQLRPDLLGMHEADSTAFTESVEQPGDSDTCLYWILVRLVFEVKKHCTPSCWLEAREQVTLYARQIFRNHGGRRFVYAIIWCHPKFEVWLFDPSGGVVSDQYEIFDGPATNRTLNRDACRVLARVFYSMSKFDDAAMGYDPKFTVPPILPSQSLRGFEPYKGAIITFPATDSHPEEQFTIISEYLSRNCLRGRGTRVWLVERKDDGKRFVLKDSWQESVRTPEWVWYEQVPEARRSILAKIYRYCTVSIQGEPDTTELARGDCGIKDEEGTQLEDLQLRVHHRILFETVGKSLKQATDFNEVIRCMVGAVKAHRTLFEEGILHRDVSVSNILIDEERGTGILIDMDIAARVEGSGGVMSKHRSGTLLFMAHEVIAGRYIGSIGDMVPFCHGAQHDLESFVWVIMYVAVTTRGYESALDIFQDALGEPHGLPLDLGSMATKKYVYWADAFGHWGTTLQRLQNNTKGPHPLCNIITRLREVLLIGPGPQTPLVLGRLYDEFIHKLEDGIVPPPQPIPAPKPRAPRKRSKSTAVRVPRTLRPRTTQPDYNV